MGRDPGGFWEEVIVKIILKISVVAFMLSSACAPVPVIVPTLVQPPRVETNMETATSLPTETPVPSFTSTPTLAPFPTLDEGYYFTPSFFSLVYIKMFDELNGWGWATNYDGSLYRPVRTFDGGKSWMDVAPINRFGVTRFFFLDSETAWISDVKWSQTNQWKSLYFTKNGGMSWEAVSVPPEGVLWLYFIDSSIGWLESGSDTLYQTIDSGRTWNKFLVNSPIGGNEFLFRETTNVWISSSGPTNPGFKYLDVSWDGGKTWETKNMPFSDETFSDANLNKVNLPVFFGHQIGYVTAQYTRWEAERAERLLAVFVTNDGGYTWTQQSSLAQKLSGPDYIDFVSPEIAFTTCEDGLCMTRDGAKTWQVIQLNERQRNFFDKVDSFDVDFVTDLKGWLLTWQTGIGTDLYFTDNGGKAWISLPIKVYRNQ
jgi:photosystem II stability/assembly factor-like uncharacterized protein